MPAIYSHNNFGKLVIKQLPKETKNIVKKYPDSFRIGLQGPDFMFFYRAFYKNKINQMGRTYHRADAYDFIENALGIVDTYGKNSAEYCYVLGFICHLALDDACHPYVKKFMETTGCGHAEIEGDLEHLLIALDGYEPSHYPVYKLVPANYDTAVSMEPFYEELTAKDIYICLKWMRFLKRFFTAPCSIKRNTIHFFAKISGNYKSFKGHIIEPTPNNKCRKESVYLHKRMKVGTKTAIQLIENFNSTLDGKTKLSQKFHKDFYNQTK